VIGRWARVATVTRRSGWVVIGRWARVATVTRRSGWVVIGRWARVAIWQWNSRVMRSVCSIALVCHCVVLQVDCRRERRRTDVERELVW